MATHKESEDVHIEKKGVTMIEDVDGTVGMDTIEDTKPGAFVWLCASAAAIGGMLFGCKFKSTILHWFVDLHSIKTTPVSSPVSWSFLVTTSAAEKSQTPRKRPSQHCAPPVHSSERSLRASHPISTVASLPSGSPVFFS